MNLLVLIIHEHVCFPQKLKTYSPSTCPRMSSPPKPRETPQLPMSILDNPAQTDITGGKPVRCYTIPSSAIVLPENRALDNPHRTSERAGTTQPQFTKVTPLREAHWRKPLKTENGTPFPPPARKPAPAPITTDMRHSITGNKYKQETYRNEKPSYGMEPVHKNKDEVFLLSARRANPNNMRYKTAGQLMADNIYTVLYIT